jgi:hypothetical protein
VSVRSRLHKPELDRWLKGQREAEKVIARERVNALLSLSTDESWQTYLSLVDDQLVNRPDATKPSFVLAAMRRTLDAYSRKKQLAP